MPFVSLRTSTALSSSWQVVQANPTLAIALGLMASLWLPGCSPSPIDEATLVEGQRALDEGLTDLKSMNHSKAAESFTEAIESGGLSPDQLGEAHFRRAACYAELRQFDSALSDLEIASEGYGRLDEIILLRAWIFEAQGELSHAEEERRLAAEYQ